MAPETRQAPGSIFSFVPAHGGSRAGAVAEQLSRTLAEGLGPAVLLADFRTRGYPLWQMDEAPQRLDGRTWGAFVLDRNGLDVLSAPDVNPRELAPLLDRARENYGIIAVDVSEANAAQSSHVLRVSEAIFLVSGSARASLENVRERMQALHSIHAEERCALLLYREPDGVSAVEAEQMTGLPLCSFVDEETQVAQLGRWLAANAQHTEALALAG
jgi:Flp pilus assembly CpaE family ATPase